MEEASQDTGLLRRAIRHLVLNWECTRQLKLVTWYGKLRRKLRQVWPTFNVRLLPELVWSGAPPSLVDRPRRLHQRFSDSAHAAQWQRRVTQLRTRPPRDSQQDFLLAAILRVHGSGLVAPLFPLPASVDAKAVRALIRLCAGMGHFARVHSHYARRKLQPFLTNDSYKRSCLYCLLTSREVALDSEWHALLACPLSSSARARFFLQTELRPVPAVATLDSLVEIILKARGDLRILDALARLCLDVLRRRSNWESSRAARVSVVQ